MLMKGRGTRLPARADDAAVSPATDRNRTKGRSKMQATTAKPAGQTRGFRRSRALCRSRDVQPYPRMAGTAVAKCGRRG